jgi:hypothetical protein
MVRTQRPRLLTPPHPLMVRSSCFVSFVGPALLARVTAQ